MSAKFKTVDEYLSALPANKKSILKEVRRTIKEAAPKAEELISYNMPGYKQDGMLVWFASNKEHVGFYPTPSAINAFEKELSKYVTSKGAIQFPFAEPMPFALITKMVKYRLRENKEKAKMKALTKK